MISFVPVENFSTTNSIMKLTWSDDIVVPVATAHPALIEYNVRTYVSLTKKAAIGLDNAYGPVNELFKTFTTKEQKTIIESILLMNLEILKAPNIDNSDLLDRRNSLVPIVELEKKLGNILIQLDQELNFLDKILEYVRENIPVSDMEGAGTKPQHSEEMTFSKEEATLVTSIAVFMKFLSPIIGTFIYKYQDAIPKDKKEKHSYAIPHELFQMKYPETIDKLKNYVRTLLEKAHIANPTTIYGGQTLDSSSEILYSTLITKRLVSVNLYAEDGNIIRYIATCCTKGQASYQNNVSSKESVKIITGPRDRVDADEGNSSSLETESSYSSRPAGIVADIKVSTIKHCNYLIEKENIPREYVDSAVSFYNTNNVSVTILSKYILASYFGSNIGGGASIELLRYDELMYATVVLQYIFAKLGLHSLVHALTFKISDYDRTQSNDDYSFMNAWKGQPEYNACRKVFPAGFGMRDWNSQFNEIAEFLIKKTITYNTAPSVWNLLEMDTRNGDVCSPLEYTNIMVETMRIVKILFIGATEE